MIMELKGSDRDICIRLRNVLITPLLLFYHFPFIPFYSDIRSMAAVSSSSSIGSHGDGGCDIMVSAG